MTATTARIHFGMNGKRVFDDSHVTWCQTLKRLFWEGIIDYTIHQANGFLSQLQSTVKPRLSAPGLKA